MPQKNLWPLTFISRHKLGEDAGDADWVPDLLDGEMDYKLNLDGEADAQSAARTESEKSVCNNCPN